MSIATSRTSDLATSNPPSVALTEGFQSAFLVGAGFAVIGAILAALLIATRDSDAHRDAAQAGDAPTPVPV